MIERTDSELSMVRQCALLGVARSSLYYRLRGDTEEELALMRRIDRLFTDHPMYGSRRMQVMLGREGTSVGRRRVWRLMGRLGLWAVGPRHNTSRPHPAHPVYPYLLRGLSVDCPKQVWATDIAYIPMAKGFLYLVAILDCATGGARLAAVEHAHDRLLRGRARGGDWA